MEVSLTLVWVGSFHRNMYHRLTSTGRRIGQWTTGARDASDEWCEVSIDFTSLLGIYVNKTVINQWSHRKFQQQTQQPLR